MVFDHQRQRLGSTAVRCGFFGNGRRRGQLTGQDKSDRGALAGFAFQPNVPAQQEHQMARQGQAQPGPLLVLGAMHDLAELLPNRGLMFLGNADARISHFDPDGARLRFVHGRRLRLHTLEPATPDRHRSSGGSEFDGIGKKVIQHLAETG